MLQQVNRNSRTLSKQLSINTENLAQKTDKKSNQKEEASLYKRKFWQGKNDAVRLTRRKLTNYKKNPTRKRRTERKQTSYNIHTRVEEVTAK